MPRKQNGFGSAGSFGFKKGKSISTGKVGAAGRYPSDRRYGASVGRTVIEQYDLNSDWVKWRRGFEYYNKGAWYRLQDYDDYSRTYSDAVIRSKLYQGTDYEVDVMFDGYKFATKNADSGNHYVIKRTTISDVDLGVISAVRNDASVHGRHQANREIWCQGTGGSDSRLLLQMIGERLSDGETEATLTYVLTASERPGLFIGKSDSGTTVRVTIPKISLIDGLGAEAIDVYQQLVGKVCYIKQFYSEQSSQDIDQLSFIDGARQFTVSMADTLVGVDVEILDPGANDLPPSLYDISDLETIYSASGAEVAIEGTYTYNKDLYQRFYGQQYLTAEVVEEEIEAVSFVVMPFTILGIEETDEDLILVSMPFTSELKLYADVSGGILVFDDRSFIRHSQESVWQVIDTDVDPWMDEVFRSGQPVVPATVYSCSCPNHSHALLRAPQESEDEATRKINRQRRYPLPTVLGQGSFHGQGVNQAAGLLESWESREHRMSFKMCKHSIAAMFIEKVKVKEPSSYPTLEARQSFEAKLEQDMAEVDAEFFDSYRRGGITALEIIFALAQGLNLDDIELGYVMLNSTF